MSPLSTPSPPHPLRLALLRSCLMIAFAFLLLAAAQQDYLIAQQNTFLRADCLIAAIAAGTGIAFCLGGAIHFLDLAAAGAPWFWRTLLLLEQRLLMLGQIAAAALVVAALGLIIFHEPIPGPDRSVLDRNWSPANPAPAF